MAAHYNGNMTEMQGQQATVQLHDSKAHTSRLLPSCVVAQNAARGWHQAQQPPLPGRKFIGCSESSKQNQLQQAIMIVGACGALLSILGKKAPTSQSPQPAGNTAWLVQAEYQTATAGK